MNYPNWTKQHDLLVRLCGSPHSDLTTEAIEVISELRDRVQFLENIHARQQEESRTMIAEHEASMASVTERAKIAEHSVECLESLRPIWAMGYSSDSMAAQATSAALSALWGLMGVSSQTEALATLRWLLAEKGGSPSRPDLVLEDKEARLAKAELATLVASLQHILGQHERRVLREGTLGTAYYASLPVVG